LNDRLNDQSHRFEQLNNGSKDQNANLIEKQTEKEDESMV